MDMRKYFLIILLFTGFVSQGQTPMRMLAKKATVSTPVLEALNFTNVTSFGSGFVQSPTGQWGVASCNGGYGVATKSLTSDGWIEAEIPDIRNNFINIGLSTNNTLNEGNWDYTLYIASSLYVAGNIGLTDAGSGTTPIVGDKIRLKRTGTTITAEYYRSGSWTILYSFTTHSSATLYLKIQANSGAHIVNPKGYNIH